MRRAARRMLVLSWALLLTSACTGSAPHARTSPSPSPSASESPSSLDKLLTQQHNEVFDVSRRFVIALTTYDAASLREDERRVLALATDGFYDQYKKLIAPPFNQAVTELRASSRGSIISLTVPPVVGLHATVIAVVLVTASIRTQRTPRVDTQHLELGLVQTSTGWKVAHLTVLSRYA